MGAERLSCYSGVLGDLSFYVSDCAACGVVYAIPTDLERTRRTDGQSLFCPNGHTLSFAVHSVEEQLRKELAAAKAETERARQSLAWAETTAKGANIQRGKAEAAARRLRQRVSAGVCPCCQRTFKQLAAHMKVKHPEAVDVKS